METTSADFTTPRGFSFEPELTLPAPRQIPAFVKEGSYARANRRGFIVAIGVGLALLSLAHTPFVDKLGYYVLPLAYLDWAGWIVAGLGGLGLALHACHVGR